MKLSTLRVTAVDVINLVVSEYFTRIDRVEVIFFSYFRIPDSKIYDYKINTFDTGQVLSATTTILECRETMIHITILFYLFRS